MRDFSRLVGILSLVVLFTSANGLTAFAEPQGSSDLKEISFQKTESELEVLIKVEGDFTYETFELFSPPRLVIDFTPVPNISAEPFLMVEDFGVVNIRAGQFQPQVARVVFDLGERAAAHKISKVPEGIKVTFWFEEVEMRIVPAKEEVVEEPKVEEKPKPKEELVLKPVTKPPEEVPAEVKPGRSNFFISGKVGMLFFLKPETLVRKDFLLYGETGSFEETYKLKSTPSIDFNIGKYFQVKNVNIKGGLGFNYWKLNSNGSFEGSLPHPFTPNSPRTITFEESLAKTMINVYVYELFSLVSREKFQFWAGPVIGFAKGTYSSLDDISFDEQSPFGSSDITITSKTFIDDSFSTIWTGLSLTFEYLVNPNLSVVFDGRLNYIDPKILNLGKRANLTQVQALLGLQYNF